MAVVFLRKCNLINCLLISIVCFVCMNVTNWVHLRYSNSQSISNGELGYEPSNRTIFDHRNVCHSNSSLLIVIKSRVSDFDTRSILRQSFLKMATNLSIPYLFVVGTADSLIMDKVLIENQRNADILMVNISDTYNHLTHKSIFVIDWVSTYCTNKWLLYIDDDVIPNLVNIMRMVESMDSSFAAIYGNIRHNSTVIRDFRSKWFVSYNSWPSDQWPMYLIGAGVLYSPSAIIKLTKVVKHKTCQPIIRIDDIYVNGIVAKCANVMHRSLKMASLTQRQCKKSYFDILHLLVEQGRGDRYIDCWKSITPD